jgi:hypothetical protein
MECAACHFVNPAQARFCAGCGAQMEARCPSCGGRAASAAKFCNECGAAMATTGVETRLSHGAAPVDVPEPPAAMHRAPPVEVRDPVSTAQFTPMNAMPEFASAGGGASMSSMSSNSGTLGVTASGGFSLEQVVQRMLRAVRLERGVFEEVQFDPAASTQALVAVLIVSMASGIGQTLANPRQGFGIFVGGMVGGVVGWYVWSYLTYLVGVKVFGGRATPAELRRTMGFAYAPGIVGLLVFIPVVGGLLALAAGVWDMVTGVVAVRSALDFDTSKAIWTIVVASLVAFVALLIVVVIFAAILAGLR